MKYKISVDDKWGTRQIITFTKNASTITNTVFWGSCEITTSEKPNVKSLNKLENWSIYDELEIDDFELSNCKSDEWSFSDDISEQEQERILERFEEENEEFLEYEEGWSRDMDIYISGPISVEKIE